MPKFLEVTDTTAARSAISAAGSQGFARTITVGPGGDFATLNAAINEATKWRQQYVYAANRLSTPFVNIRQLSGFVMAEHVFVVGQDLGFITLTSEDAEVTIQRSALSTDFAPAGGEVWRPGEYPAFCGIRGATLPIIRTLYSMDNSGSGEGTVGVALHQNSRGFIMSNSGVKNAGWRGLYVENSYVSARFSIWDGSGHVTSPVSQLSAGCRISNGYGSLREAKFRNCNVGIYCSGGYVGLIDADVSNAGYLPNGSSNGLSSGMAGTGLVVEGAYVSGGSITANNCRVYGVALRDGGVANLSYGDTPGDGITAIGSGLYGVAVSEGSTLIAHGSDISTANGRAVFVTENSRAYLAGSQIATTSSEAAVVVSASDVSVQGASVTSSVNSFAVRLSNGARLHSATATLTSASANTVEISSGSTVLDGTDLRLPLNQPLAAPRVTGQINDTNNKPIIQLNPQADSVNYVDIRNAAAAGNPRIAALGADTNIGLELQPRGTGSLIIRGQDFKQVASFNSVADAANHFNITNSASGSPLTIGTTGTDTNVSLNLTTRGSGVVQANGVDIELTSRKGQANGYASLDAGGLLPVAQVPSSSLPVSTATQTALNAKVSAPDAFQTGAMQTMPRWAAQFANLPTASGTIYWAYIPADQSFTASHVTAMCGQTAAGATPTLVRFGIYSVDSGTGDLTLIASTANDTALLAVTHTVNKKALSSTVSLTSGTTYAVGLLIVTAAAAPQLWGAAGRNVLLAEAPRLTAALTGQTDLPGTVSAASLINSTTYPWFKISSS